MRPDEQDRLRRGGGVVFTQGLLADLFGLDLGPVHIALHDIDPERLDTAAAAASYIATERGVTPRITAHLDRRGAGATAVALPVERIWDLCDELVIAHGNYLELALRSSS
ncbi:glycosyl hydrolase family 4 [Kribbella steppae]|uniref:Glycosyl hydrolase family 4 n=1 Tax=Kribbella steppae TaxID=2512223 RepID=A0A4R2H0P9_9ACTN|nr:hypothetical protein [Kribbella steppae]TCO16976.1 glycosyl hydrolase family 4 [Kribbella steppae]